ncbi:hypothetical protein NVS55_13285 [Myxococcus stipitatus]
MRLDTTRAPGQTSPAFVRASTLSFTTTTRTTTTTTRGAREV